LVDAAHATVRKMSQEVCAHQGCGRVATARVLWPGKDPVLACSGHAERTQNIGASMGVVVLVELFTEAAGISTIRLG